MVLLTPDEKNAIPDQKLKNIASSPFQYNVNRIVHKHSPAPLFSDRDSVVDDDTDGGSSDTDSEFDWDAEDDEERKQPTALPAKEARRGRRLYLLFLRLARPIRIFIIALVGSGILITPFLVTYFHFRHKQAVFQQVRAWSVWLAITWALGCLTSLNVGVLPFIVLSIASALKGKPSQRLTFQLELLFAVSRWLVLALDVSWMWITLSVTRSILEPPGHYWVVVNRTMQALFSAAIIFLAEKIFVQYVAIQFHKKALSDRLETNKLALKALDRLSNVNPNIHRSRSKKGKSPGASRGPSRANSLDRVRPDTGTKESEEADSATGGDVTPKTAKQNKRSSVIKTKLVGTVGKAITQVALRDSKLNRENEIGGIWNARKLARKLFFSLNAEHPDHEYLVVDDFVPHFSTPEEGKKAFSLFDKDNNGDLSKKEMKESVLRIYRERKALAASLKDVGSAVSKLDAVVGTVAVIIIAFIWLLIFNPTSTISSLVPLATIILGFSFVFGHSAQLLFESLIFIFSTHVFDVGDLVLIDDQPLFVKEFGLFSTTFKKVDGSEIIAPNTLLAGSKLIHNFRRSSSQWETTDITVSYDTPLEAIEQLKLRLQAYIAENNREWSGVYVNIDKVDYQNAIMIKIGMEHKSNWQDWGGRWNRRNGFIRNLKAVMEELEIGFSLPVQPVYIQPQSWPIVQAGLDGSHRIETLDAGSPISPSDINRAPIPPIHIGDVPSSRT